MARDEPDLSRRGGATPGIEEAWAEDLLLVGRALNRRSEDHRRVIPLRFTEGLSHRVFANEMGRSEPRVSMLFSRDRAALALELERRRSPSDEC